jgi:enolase
MIEDIKARSILDSRGDWTLEVQVALENGLNAKASVPMGKSRGSHEVFSVSPEIAIKNIKKIILPKLKGLDPVNLTKIDEILLALDGTKTKSNLGGNTLLAVSIGCLKAGAKIKKTLLWKHLREVYALKVGAKEKPRLFANLINGGLHAGNNLHFQEYLIIPRAKSFLEAITLIQKIYQATASYLKDNISKESTNVGDEGGFAPNLESDLEPFEILTKVIKKIRLNEEVDFGLDAAASNLALKNQDLSAFYRKIKEKFPLIYLEDPFGEENFSDFSLLMKSIGKNTWIAGDDLTTTNIERIKEAVLNKSINAIIIKPNQIGTISETIEAIKLAREEKWKVIVSHRSGETVDDFIADLAFGVGADGIKLGAPARGERVAKYNRLLQIELEK